MDTDAFDEFLENPFGDAPCGLEELNMVRGFSFVLGLPPDAPAEFKRYVLAAAQTYGLGNRSIDHVLKRYGQDWELKDGEEDEGKIISTACREVKAASRKALIRLHRFHKPAHAGVTGSWAALYRLQATIRTAVFTIRHGFHFESACLLRLFVEQLAWVAAIYQQEDFGSIFKLAPIRSLRALKAVFPRAGYVYGLLSEKAHITPEQTKRYIESDEQGRFRASLADADAARLDAYLLLIVADWYIVLCELVVADYRDPDPEIITRDSGTWRPHPKRPFWLRGKELELELYPKAASAV